MALEGDSYFFRVAIKSKCDHPVNYLVSMFADDWVANVEHAYPTMDIQACVNLESSDNVIACLVTVDQSQPLTGW